MTKNYKFKDVKVYSSDEWMANATKKYRTVFDRMETTYIRTEFSFYNKLFDEREWTAKVTLKSFLLEGTTRKELCCLVSTQTIKMDDNIVYVRDGWGTPTEGTFWLKGNYIWEAYIDDEFVGGRTFFITDAGKVTATVNPYFSVESVKLFAGKFDGWNQTNRTYLKKFNRDQTPYLWVEFKIKTKTAQDWNYEFFFNFYDDAGQPKGQSMRLGKIEQNQQDLLFTFDSGWGSETAGTWKDDKYTVEIVFMDTLVALVPFQIGETNEEGATQFLTTAEEAHIQPTVAQEIKPEKTNEELLAEGLAELNALTGMNNIKKEINELVILARFYKETGKDLLNKLSLHSIFTGNPGTGKTTIARIVSKIYKGLGLLSKGHVVEVDRETLVAGFVGQTAIKTGAEIEKAQGGILFIDEAYSLTNSGVTNDFGMEAIQIILKRMEDLRGKFGVIVAGYPENMIEFINSNPGFKSRFDRTFQFMDYLPEEMLVIAKSMLVAENMIADAEAEAHLKKYFEIIYSNRDKYFGNARTVRQVIGESIKNQNLRLAGIPASERTAEQLQLLIIDDVKEFDIENKPSRGSSLGFKLGG